MDFCIKKASNIVTQVIKCPVGDVTKNMVVSVPRLLDSLLNLPIGIFFLCVHHIKASGDVFTLYVQWMLPKPQCLHNAA